MRRITAWLALVLLCPRAVPAQTAPAPPSGPAREAEAGRPFVRTYLPRDVGGDGQNWAMVQDARGVIYVGSAAGIIQYDGAAWRLIETPSLSTIRSLDIDSNGRIYAGSVSDSRG